MIKVLLIIFLSIISMQSFAIESDKQIEKAMSEYYSENVSSAVRRLQVLINKDPDNYRARWLMLHFTILDFNTTDMNIISQTDQEVKDIIQLAIKNHDEDYAHYISSIYARNHKAYEISLREINEALKTEPQSVLYNWVKANLLIRTGIWKKNNDLIYEGIDYYNKVHKLANKEPPPYFTDVDYHFKIAWSLGKLSDNKSCPSEAIDHYLAVTQLSTEQNKTVAYSWNNVSCAYRKLGQCEKAKEASENALKIMEFGAAKTNLQYSEFCIQMQKMNLWSAVN